MVTLLVAPICEECQHIDNPKKTRGHRVNPNRKIKFGEVCYNVEYVGLKKLFISFEKLKPGRDLHSECKLVVN
jgi:hypothetical protein